jgi:hypothetical protein
VGLAPPMFNEIVGGAAGASVGASRVIGAGGREPPMLREMVGGGAGVSLCGGRSMGWDGGNCGWPWGILKARPGTNSNAPAFSLLMSVVDGGVDGGEGGKDHRISI